MDADLTSFARTGSGRESEQARIGIAADKEHKRPARAGTRGRRVGKGLWTAAAWPSGAWWGSSRCAGRDPGGRVRAPIRLARRTSTRTYSSRRQAGPGMLPVKSVAVLDLALDGEPAPDHDLARNLGAHGLGHLDGGVESAT